MAAAIAEEDDIHPYVLSGIARLEDPEISEDRHQLLIDQAQWDAPLSLFSTSISYLETLTGHGYESWNEYFLVQES